jgi:hypothetical protein
MSDEDYEDRPRKRPRDDDDEEQPRKKRQEYDDEDKSRSGRNGFALAAYYCGVFSLIPLCGILSPIAIILGIIGFFKSQSMNGKGMGHSIAGVVLGFIVAPIVWVLFYVVVVVLLGVSLTGKK